MSGSYPDIAADWTQNLPNHQDLDGYHDTSGTSFATPKPQASFPPPFRRSAPVLATLVLARRMIGTVHWSQACWMLSPSLTNADVRDALNRSAWYPSSSTWDPFWYESNLSDRPLHPSGLGW